MRTEIVWAELHGSLFLAGTNLGMKLDPKGRSGIKMEYDEQRRHLYVTYNSKTCRIPETSVLSMVEGEKVKLSDAERFEIEQRKLEETIPFPPPRFTGAEAQVSTPMSHVHAGLGAGQTGQEEPAKRKAGRPKGS